MGAEKELRAWSTMGMGAGIPPDLHPWPAGTRLVVALPGAVRDTGCAMCWRSTLTETQAPVISTVAF